MQVSDAFNGVVVDDELNGEGIIGVDPVGHLIVPDPVLQGRVGCQAVQVLLQFGPVGFKAFVIHVTVGTYVFSKQFIP